MNEHPKGSVVFFGCSFTFGEGLPDEAAMPYRVGVISGGQYQIRNFAFHTYGAHQMLSALESGVVEQTLDRPPTHVIYVALPDHVARAVGLHDYQFYHPRFVRQSDGSIVREGTFADLEAARPPPSRIWVEIKSQLEKSYVLRRLIDSERPVTDEDEQLWLGIVLKSRDLVKAKYPGAEFHVLMWNYRGEEAISPRMPRDLAAAGVTVHKVRDILPGYDSDPTPYQLSPLYDRHPSVKANDLIAQYVVRDILERPCAPSGPRACPAVDTSAQTGK